ncbi:MAG TPA: NnrU family protein [Hyphomicrobiaceae bacterium]|nr:NnrU family protein [Hyphomicrobiaceae bacterium]
MLLLTLGLALFIAIHLVPTQPQLRASLVGRFGEGGYKGVFSLISLAGLALVVMAWAKAKHVPLWTPPGWGRHAAYTLMLPVFPLLVMAYLKGPIAAAIRHPMVAAVKLWALAHLFVRGDLASLILFGGLLVWAVVDRISLKKRERAGLVTIRAGGIANDLIAIAIGLVLFALMLRWGHAALIGIALMSK